MVRLGALVGGGNVPKGVDGDDHAGQVAGESCDGLGSGERDIDGVVAERGPGVEQARDGVGLASAYPVVSTSAPTPVAGTGSDRTGWVVLPVVPVVPLAA